MKTLFKLMLCTALMSVALLFAAPRGRACTRIVYVGADSLYIVGRSLDWKTPIPTNIYVYPAGIAKQGNNLPGSVSWVSNYGSVYAVSYDGGITEGMNEKGLCINGLFCKGTVYSNDSTASLPPMSLAMFVGWLLDLNATTAEVVATLRTHNFNISGASFDGGTVSALHWGVTDASGQSAVFEFDHGSINIYCSRDLLTLTNDPAFPKMQAINEYWQAVGGGNMLPGTVRSADRFVRADYFVRHVKVTDDADLGVVIARSVLQNASVPYQYSVEGEPNLSSTQWRSFANLRERRYYFDVVTNPGIFYIDLNKCNLKPGAPVLRLDVSKSEGYLGDATSKLRATAPFTPMY